MQQRYADGDTILHSLARRGTDDKYVVTLKRLLGEMSPGERSYWLNVENFAHKKPVEVCVSYETKLLLDCASMNQDRYFMPTPPQVLIFYSTINREGADQEAKNLEEAFHGLMGKQSSYVQLIKDPSKNELLKKIDDVALTSAAPSGLFVIVIAHGKDGNVQVGKDEERKEPLKIQDILDRMCELKEDHSKFIEKKLKATQDIAGSEEKVKEALEEMLRTVKTKKDRLEGKPKVIYNVLFNA